METIPSADPSAGKKRSGMTATNSWLAIHRAHPDPDTILWHVYLKEEHRFLGNDIRIGDHIFFYEAKNGYGHFDEGRMGIVRISIVSATPYQRNHHQPYAPGNEGEWDFAIPAEPLDTSGFVPRTQVNVVMGYAYNYVYYGYNRGKGIKQLTPMQADELFRRFRR
jgi:hypothetical protein